MAKFLLERVPLLGSTRLKVLHLVHSNQRRGAELFAVRLADNLDKRDFESALCVLHHTASGTLPCDSVRTFPLGDGSGTKWARTPIELGKVLSLHKVLRNFQPDIILCHGSSSLKYGALSRLLYRKPVRVYKNIGIASFWSGGQIGSWINRKLIDQFQAVVSVSKQGRGDFISTYGVAPERVEVINNGLQISDFDMVLKEAKRYQRGILGLTDRELVLMSVGSLTPEKQPETLVDLASELLRLKIPCRLLLVGEGFLRPQIESQILNLGLTNCVHLVGDRSDVPALLAAADLFVMPSRTENMPAALIEAGLAGLASVAYNVGGVAEVVEHGLTGLLAPPQDFQELLRATASLCQDPGQRQAMGAAARHRCLELFDIKKVARQYEELFTRLLGAESSQGQKMKVVRR